MIILINGTSSVGKSSIATQIQFLAKEPFLHFCMDHFFSMLYPRFDGLGADHLKKRNADTKLGFYTSDTDNGYRIESGILGNKLSDSMPEVIKVIASKKLNLAVPTVISDKRLMQLYKKHLKGLKSFLVYVDCDEQIIAQREADRKDRIITTSIDLLRRMQTTDIYDYKVDSSNISAKQLAQDILIQAYKKYPG